MQKIVDKQFHGWKLYHNYSEALNGRIWLLWKDQVQGDLVAITNQSIKCCIIDNTKKFYLSAIYGSNDGVSRRDLWNHLQVLNNSLAEESWMFAGDFNVIAHIIESSNEM